MLTCMVIKGNNQYAAAHYFAEADNYYAREGSGVWHGKGAAVLGLEGEIDQTVFSRLMGGQLPDG
uniref:relaxase domain-containing protein n=1 Tax=Chromobacterium amazonense TaxID=1382803 RepID=UPI003F78CDD1